jgi:hypothetical protein
MTTPAPRSASAAALLREIQERAGANRAALARRQAEARALAQARAADASRR